jgi:flagellar hook-associated protein 1 FlgK
MSGLFASLNASVNAMSAHSRSIEIAGKNLANVNNSSYARQRVVYGDRGTVVTPEGAESLGLEALGVRQIRDALLDRQVMRESSLSAYYASIQSAYQRAQAGLGQSISSTNSASSANSSTDTGIAAALDDFFNAFQSLAAKPTDAGQRQALVQSASILTDRLQLADQRIGQTQSDLNAQIDSDVTTADGLLSTIADLNAQIARFEVNNPGSAVDLRDQRQTALEKLAAKLPVSVTDSTRGQVQVSVRDASGNDLMLVNDGAVANTIAFDGANLTAGAAGDALALASGSIQGSLDARNGAVQAVRDSLDALAKQLVTSVNAAYGTDFFAASGTTAGTIALASSVTAANLKAGVGAAGDNSIATAIAQLATRKFSTAGAPPDAIDGTFGGFFSSSVSSLGQALSGANARVIDQANIETLVRTQRDTVSGVNLDEEMADLMKYQRAFQASSRVFTVIDNLLDVVVNQLGR